MDICSQRFFLPPLDSLALEKPTIYYTPIIPRTLKKETVGGRWWDLNLKLVFSLGLKMI